MTVRKITLIERTSDYEQSVRDLLPEWKWRCELELAVNYPVAEISIELRNNECGPCELHVDCDDDEYESVRGDVGRTLESAWEDCL